MQGDRKRESCLSITKCCYFVLEPALFPPSDLDSLTCSTLVQDAASETCRLVYGCTIYTAQDVPHLFKTSLFRDPSCGYNSRYIRREGLCVLLGG